MALKINSIPLLTGVAGIDFISKASACSQKERIDFSKQVRNANAIIEKSKL